MVQHILDVINAYTAEFKQIPSINRTFANRYGQQLEDIREWLSLTWWSQEQLPQITLSTALKKLESLNLLGKETELSHFLWENS